MAEFRLPLSGGVTQSFPWSFNFAPSLSALGPVNVSLGSSSDPELEREILDQVGTYGCQLGQMGDVIRILLRRFRLDDLSPQESDAVEAFYAQIEAIDRLKRKRSREKKTSGAAPLLSSGAP